MRIHTDILLFGGGIAGLWTFNRLLQKSFNAVLLESRGLGGVQSIASQGIIHGGTKYALAGSLNDSAKAIGSMPSRWRACLNGDGELDLSSVQVNAEHQYLWSTESLVSKLTGFFAGKVMQSRMQSVDLSEGPALFQSARFKGTLYRLDEPVLDTGSLASALVDHAQDRCYLLEGDEWAPLPHDKGILLADGTEVVAKILILAAGSGNEALLKRFGHSRPAMQKRPLHMLMARGNLPPLYAHCLGAGASPRVTVTSHRDNTGRVVWYLGGDLSESGVERDFDQQIAAGRGELQQVLPWFEFDGVEWSTFRVDRAEPVQSGGKRPSSCYADLTDGIITTWPTKLAFAPQLADEVLSLLSDSGIAASGLQETGLSLPKPPISMPPWETREKWI